MTKTRRPNHREAAARPGAALGRARRPEEVGPRPRPASAGLCRTPAPPPAPDFPSDPPKLGLTLSSWVAWPGLGTWWRGPHPCASAHLGWAPLPRRQPPPRRCSLGESQASSAALCPLPVPPGEPRPRCPAAHFWCQAWAGPWFCSRGPARWRCSRAPLGAKPRHSHPRGHHSLWGSLASSHTLPLPTHLTHPASRESLRGRGPGLTSHGRATSMLSGEPLGARRTSGSCLEGARGAFRTDVAHRWPSLVVKIFN